MLRPKARFTQALLCRFTLLILTFFPPPLLGFHLSEHAVITKQAFIEFERCYPGVFSVLDKDILLRSNRLEDLNIVRKDLRFSHFYNPEKNLKMWRETSMVRVLKIEDILSENIEKIEQKRQDSLTQLGYAIHHIQDMSVPAHSIPVMHLANDGFETFEISGSIATGMACLSWEEEPSRNLSSLLFLAASHTLKKIREGTLENRYKQKLPVEVFWQASAGPSFGQYGVLGNTFGKNQFFANSEYENYKLPLVQEAVKNTIRAMRFFKDHSENLKEVEFLGSSSGSLGKSERFSPISHEKQKEI